jgi:hypothetical protein
MTSSGARPASASRARRRPGAVGATAYSSRNIRTMARASRFLAPSLAADADAGDCFERPYGKVECLPGLLNIGVQKAGTGELQTWLGAHPQVTVHGGEAHFFDGRKPVACAQAKRRSQLRLKYAHFLWRRRPLKASEVRGRLLFEKTPAYFDRASPPLVACAVPSVRVLVMLREPAARARSAYAMCQREMGAPWCKQPFEQALRRVLTGHWDGVDPDPARSGNADKTLAPRANRAALRRLPHLRRMLFMGQYAVFMRRWLDSFAPSRVRVLWLEQFKREPFACMAAVEAFAGLPPHPYRSIAQQNAAGLYVVGKSKSSSASTSSDAAAASAASSSGSGLHGASATRTNASFQTHTALVMLRAYYAPWQHRLLVLLEQTNTSLLTGPAAGVWIPS